MQNTCNIIYYILFIWLRWFISWFLTFLSHTHYGRPSGENPFLRSIPAGLFLNQCWFFTNAVHRVKSTFRQGTWIVWYHTVPWQEAPTCWNWAWRDIRSKGLAERVWIALWIRWGFQQDILSAIHKWQVRSQKLVKAASSCLMPIYDFQVIPSVDEHS